MYIFNKGKWSRHRIYQQIRLNTIRRAGGLKQKEAVSWAIGIIVIFALLFTWAVSALQTHFMNQFFSPNLTRTIPPFNQTVVTYGMLNSACGRFSNYLILLVITLILAVFIASQFIYSYIYKQDKSLSRLVALKNDTLFNGDEAFATIIKDYESTDRDLAKLNYPSRVVSKLNSRVPFMDIVGKYIVCYDVTNFHLKVLGIVAYDDWNVKKEFDLPKTASAVDVLAQMQKMYKSGVRGENESYVENRTIVDSLDADKTPVKSKTKDEAASKAETDKKVSASVKTVQTADIDKDKVQQTKKALPKEVNKSEHFAEMTQPAKSNKAKKPVNSVKTNRSGAVKAKKTVHKVNKVNAETIGNTVKKPKPQPQSGIKKPDQKSFKIAKNK